MENNSSSSLTNFKHQHTLLLYLVYEGFKCGALTIEEKIKMKELIFMKHPIIYTVLKKYEENGQVGSFWLLLKELINNASYEIDSHNSSEIMTKMSEEESDRSTRGNCLSSTLDMSGGSQYGSQYQMSSPSDTALIRQKKKKRVMKKIEKEFQEKSEESIKESHSGSALNLNSFKNLVKMCDEGCSPKITVKKRFNSEDEDGFF